MALFSTLTSASKDQSSPISSAYIPTLIQMFESKSITVDENANLESHAVLAYQAIEVSPKEDTSTSSDASKLFGQRRNKENQPVNPNLGVWNCCISKNSLVDLVLQVPDPSRHYCMTVDLSDPSAVEPTLGMLHEALVRLLIQQDGDQLAGSGEDSTPEYTTSLLQLKSAQFGLAPDDKPASTSSSPAESDGEVKISLIICALLSSGGAGKDDDYKETQAQNLVLYHLRRYASALNCTLAFCGKTEMEIPHLPVEEVPHLWQEWVTGNNYKKLENVFAPSSHQPDLIESVLLRNAQYAGQWDASTDSLWKALPPFEKKATKDLDGKQAAKGDNDWLNQLLESCGPAATPAAQTPTTAATPTQKDANVTSFFEDLLKK